MAFDISNISYLLIAVVINVIVNSFFVWLAGKAFVGSEKAKFTDAVWIVILGAVIGGILGAFLSGIIGSIISFIIWLGLIKHFFDCGWVKAFLIAIVAVVIQVIISFIIGIILGVTILTLGF